MDDFAYEEENVGRFTVRVVSDDTGGEHANPMEFEEVFSITYKAGARYQLGNESVDDPEDFLDELADRIDPDFTMRWEDRYEREEIGYEPHASDKVRNYYQARTKARAKLIERGYFMLPVYAYVHSGVSLTAASVRGYPFTCPWDAGQSGIIYAAKADIRKAWEWKVLTKAREEKILEVMRNLVEVYGQWLNGEVYLWEVVDEEGDMVDCCGGFVGDTDYALKEGIDHAEYLVKEEARAESARKEQFAATAEAALNPA